MPKSNSHLSTGERKDLSLELPTIIFTQSHHQTRNTIALSFTSDLGILFWRGFNAYLSQAAKFRNKKLDEKNESVGWRNTAAKNNSLQLAQPLLEMLED